MIVQVQDQYQVRACFHNLVVAIDLPWVDLNFEQSLSISIL